MSTVVAEGASEARVSSELHSLLQRVNSTETLHSLQQLLTSRLSQVSVEVSRDRSAQGASHKEAQRGLQTNVQSFSSSPEADDVAVEHVKDAAASQQQSAARKVAKKSRAKKQSETSGARDEGGQRPMWVLGGVGAAIVALLAVYAPVAAVVLIAVIAAVAVAARFSQSVRDALVSMYCNWIKPVRGDSHAARLADFYQQQAHSYDNYREGLLHGRRPLLESIAARLTAGGENVWVDVGGGTGWNVEQMDKILAMHGLKLRDVFSSIIIVDLCGPLLEIAKQRIVDRRWDGVVKAVQGDACVWQPPAGVVPTVVTFSYSLSMIPDDGYHAAIDNAISFAARDALFGFCDFYVSSKFDKPSRVNSTFQRVLWRTVFDFDGVHLGPERRAYVDHRFSVEKEHNSSGSVPWVPFLRVPYYVFVGHVKGVRFNKEPMALAPLRDESTDKDRNADYYTNDFIYNMTWEDPREDEKVLHVQPTDFIVSLCSGGCNILDLVLQRPAHVLAIDMNIAQIHLLELKVIAIRQLTYEQFFSMFGGGRCDDIETLFALHLAPFLSSKAHAYWSTRLHYFKRGIYLYGGMGWLVWLLSNKFLYTLLLGSAWRRMFESKTIEEQMDYWFNHGVRKRMLSILHLFDNPLAMWVTSGVPKHQLNMIREEGQTLSGYIARCFDSLIREHLLNENYFYRVTMTGQYSETCAPRYLTREGFAALRANNCELLRRVHLRVGTYVEILQGFSKGPYPSKLIVMDCLDWATNESATEFISTVAQYTSPDCEVIWRSASSSPWYTTIWQKFGFKCSRVSHSGDGFMDSVNTYASFFFAKKK